MSLEDKLRQPRVTIGPADGRTGRIISPWEAVLRAVALARHDAALRRSRRDLLALTDHQLRDIGLTREEAEREGQRSFHVR